MIEPPASPENQSAEPQQSVLPPGLAVLIEEYRSVREEELIAVQGQISTLRYGIASCVVLIGFAVQQHGDRYLGWAVSLALVPLVVLFSAIIWMGEYERGARAGHYVTGLEKKINKHLKGAVGTPLGWEGWLRGGGDAPSRLIGGHHRYLAIACVFIGFQIASVVLGLHFYWHTHSHDPSRHWMIPVAVIVNISILLMLLGYFRSSYEHIRDFTIERDQQPPVRQRVRMRFRLYSLFAIVGFISTPFLVWLLGIGLVWGLPATSLVKHVPIFWLFLFPFLWMTIVPLVPSRGLMKELFKKRIQPEEEIPPSTKARLEKGNSLVLLTSWELERLRMVSIDSLYAPSMGRRKHITVTPIALKHENELSGILAHEVGHHRLHHLYPLGLSYLYIAPYLYFDDGFRRPLRRDSSKWSHCRHVVARSAYSLIAFPGWLAWVLLRLGWRTAEYDADRFACAAGYGKQLEEALSEEEDRRSAMQPKSWKEYLERGQSRLDQGRGLGYLPVPNEHPRPTRRLKRVKDHLWVMETLHREGPPHNVGPAGKEVSEQELLP